MAALSTSTQDRESAEPIQLYTVQDPEGQVDSVVPLRWCITPETVRMIQERGFEDPHMLIIIENGGSEVDRELVPLTDMMCYIEFRRPGTNVVHATIVASEPLAHCSVNEVFSKWDSKHYLGSVLRFHDSTIDHSIDDVKRLDCEAQLDVVVPEEMFSKSWRLTWWLGTCLDKRGTPPPRDRCQLRQRALLNAPTLPFLGAILLLLLAVLWMANAVTTAFMLLLGRRDVDFRALFHPNWVDVPTDIWVRSAPSFWWKKKVTVPQHVFGYTHESVWYEKRHPVFFVLNPPVLLAVTALGLVMSYIFSNVLLLVLPLLAVAVVALAIVVVYGFTRDAISRRAANKEKEKELQREEHRQALSRELELLTCNSQSREASLAALPRERRTVKLRYRHYKAMVCKPFAS